ncbi:MAG TPA: sugar ABC transporter substrate-binding protein [Phototrophicaceae bacterium]|nr:sugar ABC transporter substrate-binding protein [Phototrophicaceae bacterium]
MMSRKLFSVLLICLLALPIAVSAQSATQEATCTGTPITLTVDDWSSSDRVMYMQQVIDAFMQQNPCITVKLVPGTADDQNTRRLTQIATNTAPDLIGTGESWIPLYVEAGGLLDLTPYVTGSDGIDTSTVFQEKVYDQGFYKGKPYAIAKDYSTSAFYINKKLFDAAGIAYPTEGWNWNDVLNDAEQLTLDKNGNNATSPDFDPNNIVQWGTDVITQAWWRGYQSYLYSWDAHTISDDGSTTQGYLNSDNAVKAWEFYRDLIFKYHVAPTANQIAAIGGQGDREQMFADGKIAIGVTYHGPWWQDVFNQTPGLSWGVAPLPVGPNGTHESAVMWMGWGINAKTQHPQEAWELLKYLTTEPGERVFALKALTEVQSVSQDMQRTSDPYWGVFIDEGNHLGALDEQKNPYYGPCVFNPAGDLLTRVISDGGDKIDIKASLDDLATKADACLAESAKAGVMSVVPTPAATEAATEAASS